MKTIGLLGGMSWESTANYYKHINQGVKGCLGGLHSAKIMMKSIDFAPIAQLQKAQQWETMAQMLGQDLKDIERAGADFILICTNTMHLVFDEVQAAVSVPLIHIADPTGEQIVKDGKKKVGLLGTQFTMAESFYKDRLKNKFDIDVIVPDENAQKVVHDIIYNELCLGQIKRESKQAYLNIIEQLQAKGAEAIILGCTEIALLVNEDDTSVALYDTAILHAKSAVTASVNN
ncbi:aspartate/glutamate racemase family protein [Pseudoalteromonas luteoviolacea]|uniref:aspartate/glutamate racemase family protein n=1 Tax=Pseudoalteromonas luteoviolacea TaxID=43657 RepID=UPI001B3813B9|nr:aspartate/glutamate racemase family protein [Pseudoalteromonas luteoviolacea]MBQ4834976.1 aspartate/glutamate racemase family protein [Pseudoalteromonas luteoviolacea]